MQSVLEAYPNDSLKIVVFNECFFREDRPIGLDPDQPPESCSYFSVIRSLSRQIPNSLFYVNGLFLERVKPTRTQEQKIAEKKRMFETDFEFFNICRMYKQYNWSNVTFCENPTGILYNVTLALHNG